jgi:hypothetical protein
MLTMKRGGLRNRVVTLLAGAAVASAVTLAPSYAVLATGGRGSGFTVCDPPPNLLNQTQGQVVSGSASAGCQVYDAGETSGGSYTSAGTSPSSPTCPTSIPPMGEQVAAFTWDIGTTVTASTSTSPYYTVDWSFPSQLVVPDSGGVVPKSFIGQIEVLDQRLTAAAPTLDPATQYLYIAVPVQEIVFPASPPVAGQCVVWYVVNGGFSVATGTQPVPSTVGTPPSTGAIMAQLEADLGVTQNLGTAEESPSGSSYVFVPTCYWINNPAAVLQGPVSATDYVDVPFSSSGEYVYFYTLTATDLGVTWQFSDGTSAVGLGSPSEGGCTSPLQHTYKQVSPLATVSVSTTVQFTLVWGYAFAGVVTCPGSATCAPQITQDAPPVTWSLSQPVYQVEGELSG